MGASSTVVTNLNFQEAEGGGTAVHWTGDLEQVTPPEREDSCRRPLRGHEVAARDWDEDLEDEGQGCRQRPGVRERSPPERDAREAHPGCPTRGSGVEQHVQRSRSHSGRNQRGDARRRGDVQGFGERRQDLDLTRVRQGFGGQRSRGAVQRAAEPCAR